MQREYKKLEGRNVALAAVTFESPERARQFAEKLGLPWPLLIDQDLVYYHAYGMYRAGFWDVWGVQTWIAYLGELLRGNLPGKGRNANIHQRGGDVLIDEQGIVRWCYVGSGPAARPTIGEIIAQVEELP